MKTAADLKVGSQYKWGWWWLRVTTIRQEIGKLCVTAKFKDQAVVVLYFKPTEKLEIREWHK